VYGNPGADGPPASLTLANWDLGGEPSAWAYRNADRLFPYVEIPPVRPVAELAEAPRADLGAFPVEPGQSLDGYLAAGPVDGIVVVHHGQVVYERYPAMRPDERHLLMSVTKLFPALLVGLLAGRGPLDLARPVDSVIDELAAGGWRGVPIEDILHMRSGIDCLEVDAPDAYTDPAHPFFRFEASLGWRPATGPLPSTYELVAALPARRAPGEAYEYTSVNTFELSWLVERVTGQTFAELLSREIWARVGFEAPAVLCVSPAGAPLSHGGLSLTLRDLARFGLLFTPSWRLVADEAIVDGRLLRRMQTEGRPELHADPGPLPAYVTAAYGSRLPPACWQWNHAMADGDLFKGGFGGQGLYVSPGRDLVIAFVGAPRADGSVNRLRWYGRRLATGLFGADAG
jgi:CubicO group peptidase (beta-lactamase class C family)